MNRYQLITLTEIPFQSGVMISPFIVRFPVFLTVNLNGTTSTSAARLAGSGDILMTV